MYLWLWNKLPGRLWLKLSISVIALTLILLVCYYWFFPWLDSLVFQETSGIVN